MYVKIIFTDGSCYIILLDLTMYMIRDILERNSLYFPISNFYMSNWKKNRQCMSDIMSDMVC